MSKLVPWAEVYKTHRTVAGIYVKKGVAKSLICSPLPSGPYSNVVRPDLIEYRVDSRTQNYGVLGLIAAVESNDILTVFEKVDVNKWRNLGQWRAKDIVEEPETGAVMFRLRPA